MVSQTGDFRGEEISSNHHLKVMSFACDDRKDFVMNKDILLFMSDQHSYSMQGYAGNTLVRTGMLDRLAREGTVFRNAMAPCPLCVPSRAAMISGQLPSNNGVLFNFSALDSNKATFLHSLNAGGYDTILCGRMHFVGPDQRHGYSERIAGDRTPVFHNPAPLRDDEGGKGVRGYDENSSVYYMGPGDSPVLEYDDYVVNAALDYLSKDHEKPQFITVGVYGPHFPYVAPKELYDYYYDKVPTEDSEKTKWEHPALEGKLCDTSEEVVRAARAAYYGLVEKNDQNVETVYNAFDAYLKRTGREGIFIYISDHGDMNGDRGYYGKQVFYDNAVHVPFIMAGAGIPKGLSIDSPVSLLDIGPTVCDLTENEVIPGDGKSLVNLLENGKNDDERMVVSEQYTYLAKGGSSLGRMIKYKNWKYITYSGLEEYDILFDCKNDPGERNNVIKDNPEMAEKFRDYLKKLPAYEEVMVHERWMMKQQKLLMKCSFDDDKERWICPEVEMLENPVSRREEFKPVAWVKEMRRQIDEA